MRRTLAAGMLAIVAIQAPGGPTIVSAFLEGSDLVISPIDSINLDPLLPPRLHQAAITRNQRLRQELSERRSDYGSTDVPFPVPPTPALLSRFYYLFDSTGVREVRPAGFKGIASVVWRGRSDTVDQVKTSGYLRFDTTSTGGFMLVTPQKVGLTIEPSSLTADSLLGANQSDYFGKGTPFRRMVREYQIRMISPTRDRWVFVQWLADSGMFEAGCSYRYSLFHFEPAPVQVQSTDAGCDP